MVTRNITIVSKRINAVRDIKEVKNSATSKTENFVWMKNVATAIEIIINAVVVKIIWLVAIIQPVVSITVTHALHNKRSVVAVILVHAAHVSNLNVIAILVEDVVDASMVPIDSNDILNRLVTNLLVYF